MSVGTYPRFGNCLCGALWLFLRRGGLLRARRLRGQKVRHWSVTLPSGEVWHFRRVRDVLPWPLCYLLFVGRFERLK